MEHDNNRFHPDHDLNRMEPQPLKFPVLRRNESPLAVRYMSQLTSDPRCQEPGASSASGSNEEKPPRSLRRQSTVTRFRHAVLVFLIRLFRCF
jgi:hypothetical protein